MLRSLKEFEREKVSATDGDVGRVIDFLFDDERWAIRHLVADTGGFFTGGPRVLISPISFREGGKSPHRFSVGLTVDKIKHSPSVDLAKPVSRQHERDFYRYYDYPSYWGHEGTWGAGAYPGLLAIRSEDRSISAPPEPVPDPPADVHLRSAKEVRGYDVFGSDGAIGQIDDFIVDDESWELRYLVIDTSKWWFGRKVLVAPSWARRINWYEGKIEFDLSRQQIKDSPAWVGAAALQREYEQRLHDHYQRPGYWGSAAPREAPVPRESGAHA